MLVHRLSLQEALHRQPNDLDIRIMPEVKPMLEVGLLENDTNQIMAFRHQYSIK
jgi:hypothetical protein